MKVLAKTRCKTKVTTRRGRLVRSEPASATGFIDHLLAVPRETSIERAGDREVTFARIEWRDVSFR